MSTSELKQEALAIVQDLKLISLLEPYGRTELAGSVVLDLLVKRDIDIHVLTKNQDIHTQAMQIAHALLENPAITSMRLSPYRNLPNNTQAILITIDQFLGPTGTWSLDLWLTADESATGFEKTRQLQEILTPTTRATIMRIKTALHEKKLLSGGMSTKIYEAVINHGVTTPKDFFAYLKTSTNK